MPDDFQYVKMPDGSYGKFNSGVSDDVIRSAVMKDFPNAYKASVPTESQAISTPPTAPMPQKPAALRQSNTILKSPELPENQEVLGGPLPLPGVGVPAFIGGLAGGYGGGKAGEYAGNKLNLGPTGKTVAQYAGSILGSILGGGAGQQAGEMAKPLSLEIPEKINLPGGFKINRNVPLNPYEQMGKSAQYRGMARESMSPPPAEVDPVAAAVKNRTANWIPTKVTPPGEEPLPLPMRAHAEMESDIQAAQQQRAAGQAEMNQDIAESRQGRASARQEMYGDLAQARGARPDQLTQAMREGRAAKLPIRMPRPAASESQSPFAGLPSSSPSDTAASPQPKLPFLPSASESTTTGAPAAIVPKGATPKKSLIVEPGSEPPDVKVTYQSVPQPDLLQKVMSGDKLAITEWQRRGLQLPPNVGYMVESGAGTLPWRNYRK